MRVVAALCVAGASGLVPAQRQSARPGLTATMVEEDETGIFAFENEDPNLPAEAKEFQSKYKVLLPKSLDKSAGDHTKFDMFKAKYMGKYNVVKPDAADMSYEEFGAYVTAQEYSFKFGDLIAGTVVKFDGPKLAMVEVGAKSSAVLPLREATIAPLSGGENVADYVELGEQYEFQIVSDSRDDGQVTVSIRKIMYQRAWEKLTEMFAEDPVFEAEVIMVNRGGAICLVEGLRAFLPGSHIMGTSGASEELVGQKLDLKFLEVNQEANKLVVSNRRAVVEHSMSEMKRGAVFPGKVISVKPYGAFVEVNRMAGLLHISQISYDRVQDITTALTEGMEIKVMIIDHDKSNGRIALSTKTLEAEPGDMLRDPQHVFDNAEDTAAKYHARIEAERLAREEAAREIVLGLDSLAAIDDLDNVPASSEEA